MIKNFTDLNKFSKKELDEIDDKLVYLILKDEDDLLIKDKDYLNVQEKDNFSVISRLFNVSKFIASVWKVCKVALPNCVRSLTDNTPEIPSPTVKVL